MHGVFPRLPKSDLLLIAGDFGTDRVENLTAWLESAPTERIVAIAGNHDFLLQDRDLSESLPLTYLEDSGCEHEGVRIHGSPWTPTFGNWAFMEDDPLLAARWAKIPDDVEILLTHGPAHRILDRTSAGVHAGSKTLRAAIDERFESLRLHVFGHIHEQAGKAIHLNGVVHANVGLFGLFGGPPLKPRLFEL